MHTEVKVVDDDGNELPWGEVGELYIRGPNITPGYWNKPEATEDSFDGDYGQRAGGGDFSGRGASTDITATEGSS